VKRVGVIALGLCLAACADNAILELELDLPATPAGMGPTYAYVQSRSADTITFDGDWAGADAPEGFLLGSSATVQHVSFVTSGGAITRPLGVRVRFCSDRVCGAIADIHAQEARYVIDRAFYRGQRTSYTISPVPSATPATTEVTKCEVAGCTTGTATSYCYTGGRHFCE
jgi:hypothetical protein